MAETTKAVLDMMKADAAKRGVPLAEPEKYAKAAPEAPRIPATRPFSGSVDDILNEQQVHERSQTWRAQRATGLTQGWRERIAAAPAKIAAAKENGADAAAVKKAETTIAELQDRLQEAILAEARWYMLDVASRIMADFGKGTQLAEAFTESGGTLTFDVPGVLTFRCDLTSYEEILF